MRAYSRQSLIILFTALALTACSSGDDADPAAGTADEPLDASSAPGVQAGAASTAEPIVHPLLPLPGLEQAVPVITQSQTVRFFTTAGEIVIEVYPEAAPNAAARFVELVEAGYYDRTPVFRIIPGFVAQFGINWRTPHRDWRNDTFDDDTPLFAHERGTLAFAKAGRNTNSTQVFVNYSENNRLAAPTDQYNFAVFGAVTAGMDVVDNFALVGEPPMQLDQQRLWISGDAYLESLDGQPTMIERAVVE